MTKFFREKNRRSFGLTMVSQSRSTKHTVDDDQDRNRLVVDIYFYVVKVMSPQVVQTFLQSAR